MKRRNIRGILAVLVTLVLLLTGCSSYTAPVYDTNATACTNANVVVNDPTLPSYTIPQATIATSADPAITVSINKEGNHGLVDMTPLFTNDVFSDCSNPGDGNFDSYGRHMGIRGVDDFSIDGVPYTLGSFDDGKYNALCTNGADASVAVTHGKYTTLNVLYTSAAGDPLTVPLKLTYSDGSSETVYVGDYDEGGIKKVRNWGDGNGTDPKRKVKAYWLNGTFDSEKYIRGAAIAVNSGKVLTTVTMVNNNNGGAAWIMAMTLGDTDSHYQVNMSDAYNVDVFAKNATRGEGAWYDKKGSDFEWDQVIVVDAEDAVLNQQLTVGGVPFQFGSFKDGQNNVMFCNCQEIEFSRPFQCDAIKIVLASKNGDYKTSFYVQYTDGTYTRTTVDSPDWCNRTALNRAYTVPHAHVPDGLPATWETDHERYLFLRELDVAAGKSVKKIVVGIDDTAGQGMYANIAVFAMTAVNVKGG